MLYLLILISLTCPGQLNLINLCRVAWLSRLPRRQTTGFHLRVQWITKVTDQVVSPFGVIDRIIFLKRSGGEKVRVMVKISTFYQQFLFQIKSVLSIMIPSTKVIDWERASTFCLPNSGLAKLLEGHLNRSSTWTSVKQPAALRSERHTYQIGRNTASGRRETRERDTFSHVRTHTGITLASQGQSSMSYERVKTNGWFIHNCIWIQTYNPDKIHKARSLLWIFTSLI